ncbi:MAG: hypothetical protein J1E60_00350 [Christensenellaceae bacterium]|nr:hypothetical protein [Christensenellaceae bacterium]
MTKKKKIRIALWVSAAVAVIVLIVVLLSVIPAQREKLRELEEEKQRLTAQLNELLLKYDGMEEMLEYTGSVEFLLRYARENLGFMLEGDIRVDVDDPNAPIPTIVPQHITTLPSETPESSMAPEGVTPQEGGATP